MNDFCDEHADVEILSELFKGSKGPQLDPVSGNDTPLDELYRQAVEAAKQWEWPVPHVQSSRSNTKERSRNYNNAA